MKTEDITLADIESATAAYAASRVNLGTMMEALNQEVEDIKAQFLPQIKKLVAAAGRREAELREMVGQAPGLFDKPRTQIFHDIKVGFRKGSGGIDWDDDELVVKRIEQLFPKAQAELLIKTTKKPIAKAIQDLDVADVKKLGCRVEATGDVVVVKPVDTAVDKAVNALLKDAVNEALEEEA